jgi:predicted RNase H-like nuclease
MEKWWFYEVPNAQAAYDAVLELILNYNRDEVTGLGAVSREGKDERDHLYVYACSKDPPLAGGGDRRGTRRPWPSVVHHIRATPGSRWPPALRLRRRADADRLSALALSGRDRGPLAGAPSPAAASGSSVSKHDDYRQRHHPSRCRRGRCRAGWLVAFSEIDAKGAMAQPELQVVPTFDAVFDMALDRIAVDIPIGLLDALAVGGREADRAARRLLGPLRGTSVFSAPVRQVLIADPWPASMPPSLGLTLQAWAITPKIREVDEALRARRDRPQSPVVIETHPEVVFFDLNGGRAVELPKRRRSGREARRVLLERVGLWWPDLIPPVGAKADDLLDALACLWVAAAPIELLEPLPVTTPALHDSEGMPMQIWRRLTYDRNEPAPAGSGGQ